MSHHEKNDFKHFSKQEMDLGLALHGLDPKKPSQLSDGFRSGADWGAGYHTDGRCHPDLVEIEKVAIGAGWKSGCLVDFISAKLQQSHQDTEGVKELSSIDNKCDLCDHKSNADGGYCYMFRFQPQNACLQHTEPVIRAQHLKTALATSPRFAGAFARLDGIDEKFAEAASK